MNVRTAAVFGASGKLGRRIVAALRERGIAIRALMHRTPVDAPDVASIPGDVADPRAVAAVIDGVDVVVHLATAKEDAATFFDVSVRGTFNILEAARAAKIGQLILVGGDAALGIWFHPQPEPLNESHPFRAYPGHYAFSKVVEETMAGQYAIQYGLPVTILRSSWVFEGDDLLRHFSLLHNVDSAEPGHGFGEPTPEALDLVRRRQERIPILVDAQDAPLRRHIVHIDDVMHAFDRMLGNPAAIGRTVNIAGPAPFDYATAASLLSKLLGVPTLTLRCPRYHSFAIDISRARRELGYTPENDFARMARRAIAARTSP
jgi:nucleoside-diphosphate-sugar epimerase